MSPAPDLFEQGTPLWFGPAGRPLAGWLHRPQGARCKGAVVLCPPLGVEHTSAHSTFRRLAVTLAHKGLVAIRFDYDGTGDSAGSDADGARVRAWIASVEHATRLARESGAPAIGVVGMRMGALLGAAAAQRIGPLHALVLWDPCVTGRAFLREQRVLHGFDTDDSQGASGRVEIPGYVYHAETVADLQTLAIGDLGPHLAARTLVLTRPDRAHTTAGMAAPRGPEASSIEWREALGQAALLDVDPFHHVVPTETLETVADWLSEVFGDERRPCAPMSSLKTRLPAEVLVERRGPQGIWERPLWLGEVGLFGIMTSPGPSQRSFAPTVLFLNSGYERHIGPNRLWVALARQWASWGITSVRLDLSGLGESPVRPGQHPQVVRAPEAFDDVVEAAAAVSPGDPRNVILVGLCSGAYQALESGLGLHPRAVCAINPLLRFAPPELATGSIDPRRRLCRPPGAAASAYRRLPLPELRRRLRPVVWAWANRMRRASSPIHWLEELAEAGVDTVLCCRSDEATPLLRGSWPAVRRLRRSGRLRIEMLDDADHALLRAHQRQRVTDVLTRHLVERFGASALEGIAKEHDEAARAAVGATDEVVA